MVCPNCGEETNGLKLNNQLYCTECGYLLLQPPKEIEADLQTAMESTSEPKKEVAPESETIIPDDSDATDLEKKAVEPLPKVITPEDEEFAVGPLEAEVEVLKLVEEEAKSLEKESQKGSSTKTTKEDKQPVLEKSSEEKGSSSKIIKHNRHRTDLKKEGDFVLIPGEPDPIAEPEIEPAKENTPSPEEKKSPGPKSKSVQGKDSKELLAELWEDSGQGPLKPERVSFETSTRSTSSTSPEPRIAHHTNASKPFFNHFEHNQAPAQKPNRKKPKIGLKLILWIGIPLIFVFAMIGLVVYVNLYGIKPQNSVNSAEKVANFTHLKPTYVPAGYSISFQTDGSASAINYVYEYQPDKSKTYNLTAEKTDVTDKTVYEKVISKSGKPYTQKTTASDYNVWLVGDDTAYVVQSGVLYTIKSNSDLSRSELENIANGLK